MSDNKCPINEAGHRYFIFKTYDVFEPEQDGTSGSWWFAKAEYAILGCNCGSVVKRKIKEVV